MSPAPTTTQPKPLAGITVVDYTHYLAGPHLTRCLAALGADVIKIERPTTGDYGRTTPTIVDGVSGYFLTHNMGKRGLCINMRDPRGVELMERLIDRADVFVENYRPGALDRLGLGYAALSQRNPRLVYCSISAYGHTGPDAQRPGFGLIAEARSGAMSIVGVPGEAPPLFRMPIADMYAGMHGVAAVCAALLGRVGSGLGQHIDLALYDCMISMHDYATQGWLMAGELPERSGHDLPQSTVYGVFAAADGEVVIAAQGNETWPAFSRLLGDEVLAADPHLQTQEGRNARREQLLALTQAWVTAQGSVDACCAALDAAGVPAAPVQTIDRVLTDPQTAARNMVVDQHHPVLGDIRLTNLPFRFSGFDTAPTGPAPMLGQHNREIAAELGFGEDAIAAMETDGVLYAEPIAATAG